ncbi:MAG: prepilin-type N-terminal cleavage/methylation domain-containing protein [Verrucomicrobiales bacterium]
MKARRQSATGFTLVEVVLALALLGTALVAVLGIIPVGLEASRSAELHTLRAHIMEDVRDRIRGRPLRAGELEGGPIFYNREGISVPNPLGTGSEAASSENASAAVVGDPYHDPQYRVDVEVVVLDSPIEHAADLMAVKVRLSWPIDPRTGLSLARVSGSVAFCYYVNAMTGPSWEKVDPNFTPRIDF